MEIFNGIDMERVSRFEGLCGKDSFLRGVYTQDELADIKSSRKPERTAASLFSAKEAVSKALGRGLYGMLPREIEIYHELSGRPCVRLLGVAGERYDKYAFSLSITYKDDYVIASCVAVKSDEKE